jgi:hypothetical protein
MIRDVTSRRSMSDRQAVVGRQGSEFERSFGDFYGGKAGWDTCTLIGCDADVENTLIH